MPKKRSDLLEEIFATISLTKRLIFARLQQVDNHELSPTQIQLMMCAHNLPEVSFKELAHNLHLTAGAITQLTEPLVRVGYIKRTPDERDRRIARLSLTASGMQMLTHRSESYRLALSEVLARLSDAELELYLRVQQKMLNYLETHNESPPGKPAAAQHNTNRKQKEYPIT
ncbi:MAG TPA: MarR family transcriptional regulator [Candidatus Saccharimonadales bacterium]|nr:MarR family transcriptional regulator [Candidatus Saccharimonadales bacterium]